MLLSLSANKSSFTPIRFPSGFNVILADRTDQAKSTDSRNARGKSSLLAAINYCLGSNFPKEFAPLRELEWEFTLTLQLGDSVVEVKRSCFVLKSRVTVRVLEGGMPGWVNLIAEDGTLSVGQWKLILGLSLFGIGDSVEDDEEEEGAKLSARTLLSYVIRRAAPDDPTKIMAQQGAKSSRLHIAYLLGLDWAITHELADLKEEQLVYKAVDTAASSKFLSSVIGNEEDLLIEKQEAIRARDTVAEKARDFVLLDDPNNLVVQADELTTAVNLLRNSAFVDLQMLSLYEQSLQDSSAEDSTETLELLLSELEQAIKVDARRRLTDVAAFHARIYENRSQYLGREIDELRSRIGSTERQVAVILARRTNVLGQISAGGVLDELLSLQRSIVELDAHIRDLDNQILGLRRWARAREELNVTKAELRVAASGALDKRRQSVDRFAFRFDSLVRALYDKGGALTVSVDDDGYKVNLKVAASSSTGVSKMKLFCFDLTLLAEAEAGVHPRFLVHDSVVFDGVDPVQTRTALENVHLITSAENGPAFQYLVLLNSNEVPDDTKQKPWFQAGVRRRILETEVGGAFGIEF